MRIFFSAFIIYIVARLVRETIFYEKTGVAGRKLMDLLTFAYIIMFLYSAFISAYISTHLLTLKFQGRHADLYYYIILSLLFFPLMLIKMHSDFLGTLSIYIWSFVIPMFFFRDSFRRKLGVYIFFISTIIVSEMMSLTPVFMIKNILSVFGGPKYVDWFDTNTLFIGMAINCILGVFICVKITLVIRRYFNNDQIKALCCLGIPLILITLSQALVLYTNESSNLILRSAAYWLITSVGYYLIHIGVKDLCFRESQRIAKEEQIHLIQSQLAFSQQLADEYRNLRKFNHDTANHLLALQHLMNNGNYREAADYCSALIASSRHYSKPETENIYNETENP